MGTHSIDVISWVSGESVDVHSNRAGKQMSSGMRPSEFSFAPPHWFAVYQALRLGR